MSRILGIDFGTRRIGLALSDEELRLAFPHRVLQSSGKIVEEIGAICASEEISEIVVGLPRGLANMQDTAMTAQVRTFAKSLEALKLPVHFEEEYLSTREAHGSPARQKEIDASAATIILQSFLDRKKFMVQ